MNTCRAMHAATAETHAARVPTGVCGRAPAQQATHESGLRLGTAAHAALCCGVRTAPCRDGVPPAEPRARERTPVGTAAHSATPPPPPSDARHRRRVVTVGESVAPRERRVRRRLGTRR